MHHAFLSQNLKLSFSCLRCRSLPDESVSGLVSAPPYFYFACPPDASDLLFGPRRIACRKYRRGSLSGINGLCQRKKDRKKDKEREMWEGVGCLRVLKGRNGIFSLFEMNIFCFISEICKYVVFFVRINVMNKIKKS